MANYNRKSYTVQVPQQFLNGTKDDWHSLGMQVINTNNQQNGHSIQIKIEKQKKPIVDKENLSTEFDIEQTVS